MQYSRLIHRATAFAFVALLVAPSVHAAVLRPIVFPVEGPVTFRDDFSEPRSGGRGHEGIDMMGVKMQPLLAAVDGRVRSVVDPEASWGYAVVLEDAEGYTYHYLHMNNDTPGTDDGRGGTEHAYAPGIRRNARVVAGQLIGWMGDSGNAENTAPHLHFEIRLGGQAINPYESLLAAQRPGAYSPERERTRATGIDADKEWTSPTGASAVCAPGTLVKTATATTVYYCGADGRRHGFPNERVYASWYDGFANVRTVTADELAALPLGRNVTYRPGTRMVKITTDPKVYAVAANGELRWVTTPELATRMYGAAWASMVDDIPDALFFDYTIGTPITSIE